MEGEDRDALAGIPANPGISPAAAAALSLVLPGAGQAYIGQYWRGMELFFASAAVCFGLGLLNLFVAYDAWSLARRNQTEGLSWGQSSKTLLVLDLLLSLVRWLWSLVERLPIVGDAIAFLRWLAHPTKIGG